MEEIKSMIIQVKRMTSQSLQVAEKTAGGTDFDMQAEPIFRDILKKTRALEELAKIDNTKKRETKQRLFVGILSSWIALESLNLGVSYLYG